MTKNYRAALSLAASVAAIAFASPALAGDVVGTVTDFSDTIALRSAKVRTV